MPVTIATLKSALERGETSSVQLTQEALSRIDAPDGEGRRVFTKVFREQAMASAQASDILRQAGLARSPIDGLPISIKDLFDVTGQTTLAGSVVLKHAPPASQNAVIVQRLINAGAVIMGSTNMTEFAFSGLGINPHYGTPSSPWDRAVGRIPGGSSSGAGVSVADQMSVAAIGTDTGGSVRIPSAFSGLTGFKPTARRVPCDGSVPLSINLDSIGPLAASVSCCATLDEILSGQARAKAAPPELSSLRFAVPASLVLDGADEHVKKVFAQTLDLITQQGAQVDTIDIPEFEQLAHINRMGGLVCADAWAWHRTLLAERADQYDPRVASRIMRGKDIGAADYIELLDTRRQWIAAVQARLSHYDALLMPTSPIVAPSIKALQASDEAYFAANGLILRNPTLINFLDGCALSMPCHPSGTAPVGLMVSAAAMHDDQLINVGLALEAVLAHR